MNLRAETQEALREEEERCKRLANREQQNEDMRKVWHTKQSVGNLTFINEQTSAGVCAFKML